ncbi:MULTISPECIES: IS66 family insertion sequence element accessory protein TnpB [Alteromonas]|jgi:transposase|uniref:IS66 family insertion sequence element accessory protein TnpB n=1 Tax=Alteromonas TaxID=226 RepID=UPI001653E1CC|nr:MULTISPECIES: IS66 family insertion sequence element accessory protein TnpB [Alteromonas]MBC6987990.1 IS66 family insertion sequence element accessory protein TnpB [Alteromonas sp. BZK5]MCG7651903.1 IS66 family insertion sequence element accessory protein TnpB [Alteromonas sp. MmMcT2-5]MEC8377157.1 IS66 family insertion sequence element accessory protein TnpB [Pseudomonadota bacterium]MEC8785402.1 IS66 family insertion sequence element accessory protein TnpB [Pseudomonadota bacterium]
MKMFVEPADIYLYMDVVDFRKSINGLIVVVEQDMNLNPFRDALFVFCNKKRDKVKILYWDKTGFALWYKQLEKHRFKWPVDANLKQMHMSEQQLQWLLSGYDVIGHQPLHYNASGL